MGLTLTNTEIEKHFSFLTKWDNVSKKKLIVKLTESIEEIKESSSFDLASLYGAWEDSRSSDEINKEIRDSKVEKNDLIDF